MLQGDFEAHFGQGGTEVLYEEDMHTKAFEFGQVVNRYYTRDIVCRSN